jgi:hypothetical protein
VYIFHPELAHPMLMSQRFIVIIFDQFLSNGMVHDGILEGIYQSTFLVLS